MPIILSLSELYPDSESSRGPELWAAGPEGLFTLNSDLNVVPQPQQELYCCGAADDRILVGGMPHGVAFSRDAGDNWQASWMDGIEAPVVCIVADTRVAETGVMLAGSAGGGVLRTRNRGEHWWVCNFGLQDYTVLTLAWAPVAPPDVWPRREVVFAGTEEGIYRSPNSGLGWKRCEGTDRVFQVIAVSPDFHSNGEVLAGTEESGLWRSTDGGYSFEQVEGAPTRVDALVSADDGWLLSDDTGLWSSSDGVAWIHIPDSQATLALVNTSKGILSAGEHGVTAVD
ncbi:hypothetical protein KFU94_17395 [Chloroflexi bacterium TSY]|nr:hypothetical protein [Chloroflexi bacterium TSY]